MTNMKPPQEGRNARARSLRSLQRRAATGLNGQAAKQEVSALWREGLDAGKYFQRSGREKCFSLDIPLYRTFLLLKGRGKATIPNEFRLRFLQYQFYASLSVFLLLPYSPFSRPYFQRLQREDCAYLLADREGDSRPSAPRLLALQCHGQLHEIALRGWAFRHESMMPRFRIAGKPCGNHTDPLPIDPKAIDPKA
jgi:hypothetical protein